MAVIPFLDIEKDVRLDMRLENATDPSDVLVWKYIRDAYKDIMDKRTEARIATDGTLLSAYLASTVEELPDEMNDYRYSVICYVRWRLRSRNKQEANQARAAAMDWRDYMQSLGFDTPEPQG
jgi:hypothetical protein